ncbi:MAG TPA: STAS domain-containing protein [Spirochaetota bacterium]|nr:STAS domain-containing protein [Spirochaetota bacterium]
MVIQHRVEHSIAVVTVQGYVNHTNAVEFEEYISSLTKECSSVIIDCSQLEYLSSTGIGALMYAQRVIESGGGVVVLCHCNKEIATLIEIIAIPIKRYDSLDEAMQAVNTAPQRLPNQNISEETKEKIHEDKHYTEEKQKVVPDHGSTTFDHPIVVECPKCKSMVKVYASGKFKCPECNLHFTVDDDRTIYFDV